jgi:sorting nexin-1/2
VKAIDLVAKQRSELAAATGEFAQTITDLSACDVEKQLAHSLAAMADVGKKGQELQSTQSRQDIVTLMSTGKCFVVRSSISHSHIEGL